MSNESKREETQANTSKPSKAKANADKANTVKANAEKGKKGKAPKSKDTKQTTHNDEKTYEFEAEAWTRWEYLFRSGHVFLGLGTVQLFSLLISGKVDLATSGISIALAVFAIGFGSFLMYKAHVTTKMNRRKIIRDAMFFVVLIVLGVLANNPIGLMTIYFFSFGSPVIIWNGSNKLLQAREEQAKIQRKERTLKTIASQTNQAAEVKTGELRNMSRAERKRYREEQARQRGQHQDNA